MTGHKRVSTSPNGPVVVTFDHLSHDIQPVITLDGRHVGNLCADCGEELPTNYECRDCMWVEVTAMSDERESYVLGRSCRQHA